MQQEAQSAALLCGNKFKFCPPSQIRWAALPGGTYVRAQILKYEQCSVQYVVSNDVLFKFSIKNQYSNNLLNHEIFFEIENILLNEKSRFSRIQQCSVEGNSCKTVPSKSIECISCKN